VAFGSIWQEILARFEAGADRLCLVAIVDCQGSVPNGPGAKMIVSEDAAATGTVGGGGSERMLIDKAAESLRGDAAVHTALTLQHNEGEKGIRSGMICSGSQTFAMVFITRADAESVAAVAAMEREGRPARVVLSPAGLQLVAEPLPEGDRRWRHASHADWRYEENVGVCDRLTIVGGGHVSLALSRVTATLGFNITVLDDREHLPTMTDNPFADECRVVDYADIAGGIPRGEKSYVCIMTSGHEFDEPVLEQLVAMDLRYLGMMGSQAKVEAVRNRLLERGVPKAQLDAVHAPIGLPIGSRTPEEIAISIAAELGCERSGSSRPGPR